MVQPSVHEAPENLKPLTALRFFAAMWVVLFHFWPDLGSARPPALVAKGYLGVELFFVLSGFILSHVYLGEFGKGRFNYPTFLWARLARVYPLHLATLAGLGLLAGIAALSGPGAGARVLVWSSLPAQFTLTQAWGLAPRGGWNHPSWSISAEWFAYLAFPTFAWIAWALRKRPGLAVALALAFLIGLELGFERMVGAPLTRATIAWGALRIVPCFTLGCAVYLLWTARRITSRSGALSASVGTLAVIVSAIHLGAPDWMSIALFGALLLGLASMSSAGSAVLTSPVWVYLGEASFAVYMVCIPWQLVFEKAVHRISGVPDGALPASLWLAEYLGVIPAAIMVHHLVERPAREVMRRRGPPRFGSRSQPGRDFAAASR